MPRSKAQTKKPKAPKADKQQTTQPSPSTSDTNKKPEPTKDKDTKSKESTGAKKERTEPATELPDPETFNGAELTLTQLYGIIRTLAKQTFDENSETTL